MSVKKKLLVVVLFLLVLLVVICGLIWHMLHYTMIDFRFYPNDATTLDLRGEEISMSHYRKIRRRLDVEEILWDIPVQDKFYPMDAEQVAVTALTDDDLEAMDFLKSLKTVDATGCTDYDLLLQLQERRPELEIRYSVQIGGQDYPQDATRLELTGITEAERDYLTLLPKLRAVNVSGSENADQLKKLQNWCHNQGIAFSVTLGGSSYGDTAQTLQVDGITAEELDLVQFLPELQSLCLTEPAAEVGALIAAREAYPDIDLSWEKKISGITVSSKDTEIDLSGAGKNTAKTQTGTAGAAAQPKAAGTATQKTASGTATNTAGAATQTNKTDTAAAEVSTGTTKVSKTRVPVTAPTVDLAEVEKAMEYFPDAQTLFLGECGIDNEKLADFRERKRAEYKVVWSVQCGDELLVRTDATTFMPTREQVYYFFDEDTYNLRYCEDMICVDLGHMAITKIEWAAYMPHLKYLILAHTQVQNIDPISSCKELIFLELDYSPVKDFSPLVGCTALEDLNIGLTYADVTPIAKMTWLKSVWFVGRGGCVGILSQGLPNAQLYYAGDITVGGGWRNKQNYYDMRDLLGMSYMKG